MKRGRRIGGGPRKHPVRLKAAFALLLFLGGTASGQDSVRGGAEPVDRSIDPSKLAYDILVDGTLGRDDPGNRKFRTLQDAYAATPAGTENRPTVLGIRPGVYRLPGGAPRTPGLRITKEYITLLGLTDNRRSVVLADNRGLMQGAEDNGYVLVVDAMGFTAKNLTILNYCNTDYEYPGDPGNNLTKRSDVITQAVALQASGDKHVYENVALLGRLDTMFLLATRSYFKNVYIEGTDDWVGGGQASVWEGCTLVFPRGGGVMSAANVVFRNCRFEATRGMQFYKAEYGGAQRPVALLHCVLPAGPPDRPVAWVRGKAEPRPGAYSLTYRNRDAGGNPALIYDSNVGAPSLSYSRELTDEQARAFNPWNLLRAPPDGEPDGWDPAGVREAYEAAGEGSLIYRMVLTGGGATIRTGLEGATIGAAVTPKRAAAAPITWSAQSDLVSLSRTTGPSVVVTARNTTDRPEWVPVKAAAPNGFYATAYVRAEPRYQDPPAVTSAPEIGRPAGGSVRLAYAIDLGGRRDQSLISWEICDDAACSRAREVAIGRGDRPLETIPLMPGFAGKFLRAVLRPKHPLSDPGPPVGAVSASPVAASDVPSRDISLNARNFVTDPDPSCPSGLWTVQGPWSVIAGEELAGGYGVRSGRGPASILYQEDAPGKDMRVDLLMTPEKTAGQGFSVPGSPAETGARNLHSDVYIKYDPRTKNGYALRFWRTTLSASKCMFQLYRVVDGVGSPIDDRKVLSGVFKPDTTMTLAITGDRFSVDASNSVDEETLHLEGAVTPNRFGGAGVFWPGGSANTYSRMEIAYTGD